jgi:hypothetical protein
VGDDVSEVHAVSIFRIEVCGLVSFYVYIAFHFEKEWGKGKKNADWWDMQHV